MDISYSFQQVNLSKKCYESNWYVSCNSTWIWSLSLLFNLTCQFLSRSITSELTISFTSYFVRGCSSVLCSLTGEETELKAWSGFSKPMANNTNAASAIAKIPPGVRIYFLIALNIFLSIFATLGNVLILAALRKVSSIHPPTKLLFRCLAVTDLCVGLLGQPLYVYVRYITISLDIGNYIVELVYVFVFIINVLLAVSVLTSAAISVDRLLALLLGLRYRHVVTLCRVRVVIACVWFIPVIHASLFCVASILFHTWWWTFRALAIFSIIVSTFSYTKIFLSLRHQQAQVQNHVQPEQSSGVRSVLNITRYKETVYSVAWIQFAMLACYCPYIVMSFVVEFRNVGYSIEVMIAGELFLCLFFINSSLNPVLYCWRIKDVRQEVKNTIRQCLCCWVNLQWETMQQNNGDNCLVTSSAAMSYSGRTHFVHRISYPYTLIVFCLNRVIKDVWRC